MTPEACGFTAVVMASFALHSSRPVGSATDNEYRHPTRLAARRRAVGAARLTPTRRDAR